jgi:hypothetical protein
LVEELSEGPKDSYGDSFGEGLKGDLQVVNFGVFLFFVFWFLFDVRLSDRAICKGLILSEMFGLVQHRHVSHMGKTNAAPLFIRL